MMGKFKHSSRTLLKEPLWSSVLTDSLPPEAFVEREPGIRSTPHHFVSKGKRDKAGQYVEGDLVLHKGATIEARRQVAAKIQAGKESGPWDIVLKHLDSHLGNLGVKSERNIIVPLSKTVPPAASDSNDKKWLEELLRRFQDQAGEGAIAMDNRVDATIDETSISGENPSEADLKLINRSSLVPLAAADVFTFSMWISNDLVDTFYTQMDEATTLRNFVEDMNNGSAFCIVHGPSNFEKRLPESMPIGSGFKGELLDRAGFTGKWVLGHFFILRHVNLGGGLNTDDVIRQIQGGVWKKGSVGLTLSPLVAGRTPGTYICGICGEDMFESEECVHLPGMTYDGKVCTVRIVNASLREVSLVYLNAALGTVVNKARALVAAGKLDRARAGELEFTYRARILVDPADKTQDRYHNRGKPAGDARTPGRSQQLQKEKKAMDELRTLIITMISACYSALPEGTLRRTFKDLEKSVDAAEEQDQMDAHVKTLREMIAGSLKDLVGIRAVVEALPEDCRKVEAIPGLLALAADGRSYKADLVTAALAEGVRAEGNAFKSDHWKGVLEKGTIQFAKDQTKVWKETADARLRADGQRQTTDPAGAFEIPDGGVVNAIPEHAFQCGR